MVYQTYRIHPITVNVALPRLRQQPGPNHSSLWRNRWDASCPIQCWPAGFGYNPVVRSGIEHHFSLLFIWSSHLEQNMTSISLISNTNEKPNIRASTCCSYIEIDLTFPGNKNIQKQGQYFHKYSYPASVDGAIHPRVGHDHDRYFS